MPIRATRPHQRRSVAGIATIAALVVAVLPSGVGRGGVGPNLSVTPSSGEIGATLTAEATGFPAGPITFWWDNASLLGTKTAVSGIASLAFKIPAGASLGDHFVRACGGSFCPNRTPQAYADDKVTVVAVASTPRPTRPPATQQPTPRPTPMPTPRPTATRPPTPRPTSPPTSAPAPTPAPSSSPTPGPTAAPSASVTPSPGGGFPNPSFPVAVPTLPPTPLPVVVITPPPEPPSDEALPETPFPNLSVRDIEVTQGIQNLANDMPLVAGRRTYARVYIDVLGALSWPHTWGALEARRGGNQIGWIWPENGPIVAQAGGGDRTNLGHSLQFRLPASWLNGGVTFTTFVFSYGIDTPFTKEPMSEDNFDSDSVFFNEGKPLTVHLAPLHVHRSYHPTDIERTYEAPMGGQVVQQGANLGAVNRIISGLFRHLPVTTVSVDSLSTPVTPLGHATGHEFDLGGPCRSILLDVVTPTVYVISDWTTLMDDPNDVDASSNASYVPDRAKLHVMDSNFTIDTFIPDAGGTATLFGNSDNVGPNPVEGAPAYAYPCLFFPDAMHEANNTLALYRVFYDWADEREMFVGMVDPLMNTAFGGGMASGGTDSVTMRMTDTFDGGWPWLHSGAATLAHEAGHRAGLGHVPCADGDGDNIPDEIAGGDLDLTHPMTLTFPDCWLSEVDDRGYYGFDTTWELFGLDGPTVMSNDPAAPAPNRVFPLLGYKFPSWTDPFHYCRMLTYYGVACSANALDLPWNPPNPLPDGSDPFAWATPEPEELEPGVDAAMVLITRPADDEWGLELLARTTTPTPHLAEQIAAEEAVRVPAFPNGGDWQDREPQWLVVVDEGGQSLWQAIIEIPDAPHEGEGGISPVTMVVPLPPEARGVEVRGWDGATKVRIAGSAGIPDVAGLFTDTAEGETVEPDDEVLVGFEASDPDGDRMRYILLYAADREHWQVAGVTDEPRIQVPVVDLPSGEDPAFRVVAFDGWNVGEADIAVPELRAPRNPPKIWILTSELPRYPMRFRVRLEATAFDVEDRDIPGEAIRWRSSIDGDLGTGGELTVGDLSAGRHVLTATATDSDGLEGTATFELEIDGSVVAPVPGDDLQSGMARIFERLGAGLEPAPVDEPQPDFIWLPLGAGIVALVGLIALFGARYLRPRRSPGTDVEGTQSVSGGAAQEMSMDDTAGKEKN